MIYEVLTFILSLSIQLNGHNGANFNMFLISLSGMIKSCLQQYGSLNSGMNCICLYIDNFDCMRHLYRLCYVCVMTLVTTIVIMLLSSTGDCLNWIANTYTQSNRAKSKRHQKYEIDPPIRFFVHLTHY